jgi:hypothetical protein
MFIHCHKLNFYFSVMLGGVGANPSTALYSENCLNPPHDKFLNTPLVNMNTAVLGRLAVLSELF